MPRFFFHLDYLLDTIEDPEGSDCANLEAAKIEGRAVIRELAADYLATDPLFDPAGMSICDKSGNVLAKVTVAEAVNEILPLDKLAPPDADTA